MRGVILVTDYDWFQFLAAQPNLEEVNFWRPSDTRTPRQLVPGTPVLFKLHKRHGGWIVGYGVFAKHKVLPAWLAWETFGPLNGAASFEEMRKLIEPLRSAVGPASDKPGDYEIGCLMISQPVFFSREAWIAAPTDWPANVVQGMSYDFTHGDGARVWNGVLANAGGQATFTGATGVAEDLPRYGEAVLVRPRLGQGTFRISVLDAYGGACAVTREHSLPVLEASHIRPFAREGPRDVTNGLLLRIDLHRLFDKGYLGVDSDYRLVVSNRLRDDFSNGRCYFPLHGNSIELPRRPSERPDPVQLSWHREQVFLG
jgi:putative restriction endonuclease